MYFNIIETDEIRIKTADIFDLIIFSNWPKIGINEQNGWQELETYWLPTLYGWS